MQRSLIVGLAGCGNSTSSSEAAAKPQSSQNTQKDSSPPKTTEKDIEVDYEEDVDDDDFTLTYHSLLGTSWMYDDTEIEFTDDEVGYLSFGDNTYETYTMKVYVWDGDDISYTEEGTYIVMDVAPVVDDGDLTYEVLPGDDYFILMESPDDQFQGGFYASYHDGELRLEGMSESLVEATGADGIVWPGNLGGEAGDNDGTVWLTRYI